MTTITAIQLDPTEDAVLIDVLEDDAFDLVYDTDLINGPVGDSDGIRLSILNLVDTLYSRAYHGELGGREPFSSDRPLPGNETTALRIEGDERTGVLTIHLDNGHALTPATTTLETLARKGGWSEENCQGPTYDGEASTSPGIQQILDGIAVVLTEMITDLGIS